MLVLLVEDDRDVAQYVGRGLEEEGSKVTYCYDGASALRTAQLARFDIIVMDVMLPFMDGLEVTRRLRMARINTPILLLTGRDAAQDIVKGLDAGADDYLTKPFSFGVLLARLRARTRSGQPGAPFKLRYSDLAMDVETQEAWRAEHSVALTRTEFAILECLMKSAGRVVTRRRLIETVWGPEREVGSNNLDVFMRFLRAKIDAPGQRCSIHTVRGVGYALRDEE